MAMSENKENNRQRENVSGSHSTTSEEDTYIACDVCSKADKHVEARGYCPNCSLYLCKPCVTTHRFIPATKQHKILEECHMPRDEMPPPLPPRLTSTIDEEPCRLSLRPERITDVGEPCPNHFGKEIEYYCSTHDALLCHVDVTLDHKECKVQFIPTIADGIDNSKELKDFTLALESIEEQCELVEKKTADAITATKLKSQEYNNDVDKTGNELIEHIQHLMGNAGKDKDKHVEKLQERINQAVEGTQAVKKEAKALKNRIDTGNNSASHIFICLKSSRKAIDALKTKLTSAQLVAKPIEISFKANTELRRIKEIKCLGNTDIIAVNGTYTDTDIIWENDKEAPGIYDIQVLQDGKVVLIDRVNESAKLINRNGEKLSKVELKSAPFAITQTNTGELVVTLPFVKQLLFMKVTNAHLHILRFVKTNINNTGISTFGDKLLVCDSKTIIVLDMDGTKIRTIHKDMQEETCFMCLSCNPRTSMLYASSVKLQQVKCLTLEGVVKGTFQTVRKIWNISVLDDDSVLVIGDCSVLHLTATGNRIQVLTDWNRTGLTFGAIAYARNTKQLYLAGKLMRVLQLE